jgi:putative hydrolase of the HAD superfamily
MNEIKNIIFDYGNVIFLIDFLKAQHSFTGLGIKNVEQFFAHSGHHELFNRFEKGEISSAAFRNGIREIAAMPELTDKQIDDTWTSLLIGIPPVNHDILLRAKANYRTFLLSNINEIHLAYIENYLEKTFGLRSNDTLFEKVYYSHLTGMRKPDRGIFELVLRENNLNPAETLFIDDSPQHLETASKLGLHTHLMTGGDTLEKFMYRSGLLKE